MIDYDGIVYSLQKYGGISVYFNALIERMYSRKIPLSLQLASTGLIGRPPQTTRDCWRTFDPRILERYRDFNTSAPICHSSYYRLPNQPTAKSIVTVYDFTYERYFPKRQRTVHTWQKFRAIRKADAVLCISESTRRDLLRYMPDVDSRKVHVTHLAANSIFFNSSDVASIEILQEEVRAIGYVLFVGARSTYKNFLPLVHALESSRLHLVCIGGGPIAPIERKECEERLPGRHHFIGWVDDQVLKQLYQQAVALVFPSLYEGFGIPIVEAMASGCPVIASNVSSLPEVAGSAGILLDVVDSNNIAASILRVQDQALRNDMIAKGKRQSQQFTWEQCAARTLDIYSQVHSNWQYQ